MADGFAALVERSETYAVDQTLIDRHETTDVPYFLWPMVRQLPGSTVYIGRDAEKNEITVKTWPSIRRGFSAATDIAMTRLFDGVGRLVTSPVPGLPRYIRAGLSPTGPFVAYRFEAGIPLHDAPPRDAETALRLSIRLVQCVNAIHAMGHPHGDIAPKNIVICDEGRDFRLLDLFDMTDVGDGRVRTPAMCPANHDTLTDEQLDRYATTLIARDMLSGTGDPGLAGDVAVLNGELARARLETLDPVAVALRNALQRIEAARPPKISIAFKGGVGGPFLPDAGRYYLLGHKVDASTLEYRIFGIERELTIEVRKGEITTIRYAPANFTHLSQASQHGVPVALLIEVADGPDAGLEELLGFILRNCSGS